MTTPFSLAASGSTADPYLATGPFNFAVRGTWVGTWALERSVPGSGVWDNCVMADGSPSAFTNNGSFAIPDVFGDQMAYRITFTRTSGTLSGEFY